MKDKSWGVREIAAEALGRTKDKRAVAPLIQALEDNTYAVRVNAARALGKIGEPAVAPLMQALNDERLVVREAAAEALGQIKDKRAV